MPILRPWLVAWLGRESAQDLIEYSAILALILFAAVVFMALIGVSISNLFSSITGWFDVHILGG